MKILKKYVLVLLAGIIILENNHCVNAAEESIFMPIEETTEEMLSINGVELKDGETITIGEYTITCQESVICLNANTKSTTAEYTNTANYRISSNGDIWYEVVQVTNYTYDGTYATINTSACKLSVHTYYSECNYIVNKNTVNNSSSTDPTYTIGLTMSFPSSSVTIIDVVTVHADGTHNLTHYA